MEAFSCEQEEGLYVFITRISWLTLVSFETEYGYFEFSMKYKIDELSTFFSICNDSSKTVSFILKKECTHIIYFGQRQKLRRKGAIEERDSCRSTDSPLARLPTDGDQGLEHYYVCALLDTPLPNPPSLTALFSAKPLNWWVKINETLICTFIGKIMGKLPKNALWA